MRNPGDCRSADRLSWGGRAEVGTMNAGEMRVTVPLPAPAPRAADDVDGAGALVTAFVAATAELAADRAAQLAGVRPETLRKWRRRSPRWLKAHTARRIAAYLAGEPPADPPRDEGFRRAFHLRLRAAPPE